MLPDLREPQPVLNQVGKEVRFLLTPVAEYVSDLKFPWTANRFFTRPAASDSGTGGSNEHGLQE